MITFKELVNICGDDLSHTIADRYPNIGALGKAVEDRDPWLTRRVAPDVVDKLREALGLPQDRPACLGEHCEIGCPHVARMRAQMDRTELAFKEHCDKAGQLEDSLKATAALLRGQLAEEADRADHAERVGADYQRDLAREQEGASVLRRECGAREEETFPEFVRRLHAEATRAGHGRVHDALVSVRAALVALEQAEIQMNEHNERGHQQGGPS